MLMLKDQLELDWKAAQRRGGTDFEQQAYAEGLRDGRKVAAKLIQQINIDEFGGIGDLSIERLCKEWLK